MTLKQALDMLKPRIDKNIDAKSIEWCYDLVNKHKKWYPNAPHGVHSFMNDCYKNKDIIDSLPVTKVNNDGLYETEFIKELEHMLNLPTDNAVEGFIKKQKYAKNVYRNIFILASMYKEES